MTAHNHRDTHTVSMMEAPSGTLRRVWSRNLTTWQQVLGAANRGKKHGPCSPETRAKMSASGLGRPKSAEHRAKISASLRARRGIASVAAVLLCALLLTGCATSKGARRVTIALSLADIATTQYAIGNGFDEANPIYRRNPVERALVVNFAYIFAMDRATDRMEEEQRKYTWEWLAAVRALPVLWNAWTLAHGHASTACPARALVKED